MKIVDELPALRIVCIYCKQEQDCSEFYADTRYATGYCRDCKKCVGLIERMKWYRANEERATARQWAYRKKSTAMIQGGIRTLLIAQNGAVRYVGNPRQ